MRRLWFFLVSAGKWSITLMTGGIVAWSISSYEHIAGRSLTALSWLGIGVTLFVVGAFLSWNEQFKRSLCAGCPEVVIEYERNDKQAPPPIYVKNLGGGNAYKIQIRPMHHYFSCGSFSEISHLSDKQEVAATWKLDHMDRKHTWCGNRLEPTLENFIKSGEAPLSNQERWMASLQVAVVVDYLNAAGLKFTAQFEIRQDNSESDETHTYFIARYFNPKEHTYFDGETPSGPPQVLGPGVCAFERRYAFARELLKDEHLMSELRQKALVKEVHTCPFCDHDKQDEGDG